MAVNKKLITFATEAQFDAYLANNSIDPRSIVFIEDKKRIWTHGVFFDTSWDYITDKPDAYAPSAHTHNYLSDSPQDGKIYGRKDGDWTEVGSDVYDWTWLYDFYDSSGTCTQQQYDELLAAVQTGKIFPQAASVFTELLPPESGFEGYGIILSMVGVQGEYIYFNSWIVIPNLTVIAYYYNLHEIVQGIVQQEVPGIVQQEVPGIVQQLTNRTVQLYSGWGARTVYLSSSNFPILSGFTTLNVNFQGESENDGKEYVFQFTCGTTPVTINMPSNIKWIVEPYIEINKTYQISIVNRIAVIGGAS